MPLCNPTCLSTRWQWALFLIWDRALTPAALFLCIIHTHATFTCTLNNMFLFNYWPAWKAKTHRWLWQVLPAQDTAFLATCEIKQRNRYHGTGFWVSETMHWADWPSAPTVWTWAWCRLTTNCSQCEVVFMVNKASLPTMHLVNLDNHCSHYGLKLLNQGKDSDQTQTEPITSPWITSSMETLAFVQPAINLSTLMYFSVLQWIHTEVFKTAVTPLCRWSIKAFTVVLLKADVVMRKEALAASHMFLSKQQEEQGK